MRNAIMISVIVFSYAGQSSWALGHIHTSLFDTFGFFTWIGKLQMGAFIRLNPLPRFLTKKWSAWAGLAMFFIAVLESLAKTDDKLDQFGLSRRYLGKELNYPYIALVVSLFLIGGSIKGIWLFEIHALRFMGKVSYSWFLFQVPLLEVIGWPRGYVAVAVSCMAYVMATVSTLYIEEPIRDCNTARVKARNAS
jgi:peptidoglycan/LPS O-acetylase OafA/YrhL